MAFLAFLASTVFYLVCLSCSECTECMRMEMTVVKQVRASGICLYSSSPQINGSNGLFGGE